MLVAAGTPVDQVDRREVTAEVAMLEVAPVVPDVEHQRAAGDGRVVGCSCSVMRSSDVSLVPSVAEALSVGAVGGVVGRTFARVQ